LAVFTHSQRQIHVLLGMKAYLIIGALLKKKGYKIKNAKSGIKVNIYLGPLPEPWKGPGAWGPEA